MNGGANPRQTTVVIIGAGQAGLAMSRCLTHRSIDHVLLEQGGVANSWRTERWDSLRLLTPNWLSRLPGWGYTGWGYAGVDPEGYMTAPEVIDFLDAYRRSFDPPVRTDTTVTSVSPYDQGLVVATTQGEWHCRSVVIASGAASSPKIPPFSDLLPAGIQQLAPITYRNPAQLANGGVLVVGASASGAQIAEELQRSGRQVTLSTSDHVRLPRTYRGMDIHWWLDAIGQMDERYDEVEDIRRARQVPSLQLVGSPERRTLDLNRLAGLGVDLVGRLGGVRGRTILCSGSLANLCANADLKQQRLLDRIDEFAAEHGLDEELEPADRPAPTRVPAPRTEVDLAPIKTVVWATGYRPHYPWLDPALLDHKGAIRHDGGVMRQPGMYVLGLPFLRRRKSVFIDGVGPDARELSTHLCAHLDRQAARNRVGRYDPPADLTAM